MIVVLCFLKKARDTEFYSQIIDLGKIRGGIMQ